MTISMILDILVAALLLVFVIVGVRRGFIKSVVRLLGFAVALVVSAIASSPIAHWIYDNLLFNRVYDAVSQKVQESVAAAAGSLQEQVNAVIGTMPEGVQNLLTMYGINADGIAGTAQTTESLVTTVMDNIVTPLCLAVVQVIVFLALFLVLFLIVRVLGKVIDKVFSSIPVVKQVNGLLGGALGLAEGVLVVFVLCFAIQLYMTFTGAGSLITTAHIEQTRVFGWLMKVNPIL